MPSRGNPNVPNKQRRIASRKKVQKKNSINKISKNARGTVSVTSTLLPTSGPGAAVSGKKARKLQKAANHARQRAIEKAMQEEGEVVMTDAPKDTKKKTAAADKETKMEVDEI